MNPYALQASPVDMASSSQSRQHNETQPQKSKKRFKKQKGGRRRLLGGGGWGQTSGSSNGVGMRKYKGVYENTIRKPITLHNI